MASYEALDGKRGKISWCGYQDGELVTIGLGCYNIQRRRLVLFRNGCTWHGIDISDMQIRGAVRWRFKPVESWYLEYLNYGQLKSDQSIKLTRKSIRQYWINRRVSSVVYEIVIPSNRANLHKVFQVPQIRKYIASPTHVL